MSFCYAWNVRSNVVRPPPTWPNLCTAGNFYFLTIELAREKWLLSKGVFPGAIIRGIRTSLVDRYLFYKKNRSRSTRRGNHLVPIRSFSFPFFSFIFLSSCVGKVFLTEQTNGLSRKSPVFLCSNELVQDSRTNESRRESDCVLSVAITRNLLLPVVGELLNGKPILWISIATFYPHRSTGIFQFHFNFNASWSRPQIAHSKGILLSYFSLIFTISSRNRQQQATTSVIGNRSEETWRNISRNIER